MAKYELPQYQSMYRDPGSVQINQMKRQEFLANMQADNALSSSVMNMDALDQDSDNLESLANKYNGNIDQRSARKDYENLGMAINTDAMSFVKDYTPIQRSLASHTAFKEKLQADYDAGNINIKTRDGRLKQSEAEYEGVKYSESGTVDRDSLFKSKGYSQDVDINAAIAEGLKDKVERSSDFTGVETLLTSDFQLAQIDGSGPVVWGRKQGEKHVGIPKDLVRSVMDSVLSRPDVAATIAQQAELETWNTGQVPEGGQSQATQAVNNTIDSFNQKIENLEDLETESDEEKEAVLKTIENMTKYRDSILSNVEDGESSVDTYRKIRNVEIRQEFTDRAQDQYAYDNVEAVREYKLLDKDGIDGQNKNSVPNVIYSVGVSETLTGIVTGGVTVEEIEGDIEANQAVLDDYVTTYGEGVLDKLYAADNDEEIAALTTALTDQNGVTTSPSAVLEIVNNAKRARDNNVLLNKRIDEANALVYGDDYPDTTNYDAKLAALYDTKDRDIYKTIENNQARGSMDFLGGKDETLSTITYSNVTEAIRELGLIDEDQNTKHALDVILNSELKKGAKYTTDGASGDPTQVTDGGEFDVQIEYPEVADKLFEALLGDENANISDIAKQDWINKIRAEYEGTLAQDADKVTENLANAEQKFDAFVNNNFGDSTGKTKTAIHAAIKKGLISDMQILGKDGENVSFQTWIADHDEITNKKGGYVIDEEKTGLVNVSNQSGIPMIAVAIKNTTEGKNFGKIDYVFVPAGAIDVKTNGKSSIQEYTNSIGFKLKRLYSNGDAHNITSWEPDEFEGKVKFDYSNANPIMIEGLNETTGQMEWIRYGKEAGLQKIEELVVKEKLEKFIY